MCSKDFSMMTLVKKLTINSCLFISCIFYFFFYFRGKRQQLSCLQGEYVCSCKILDFHTNTTSSSSSSCNSLISPPLFVCCKAFSPPCRPEWHENRGYRKKFWLPPLPHKCCQLFLVVGPFTGHPGCSSCQVLLDESAFKGDSFGEHFWAWLHSYLFNCFLSLLNQHL